MVISVDPLYTRATMHEKDDVSNYICIGNERLQGGATAKTISATIGCTGCTFRHEGCRGVQPHDC